jgi:alpha-tubulin suppressor-like RCC1 family protein
MNNDGQCNVPPGRDFIAIAAGGYYSLALHKDGSAVAWGFNNNKQCDLPKDKKFTAVAAGEEHTLAIIK